MRYVTYFNGQMMDGMLAIQINGHLLKMSHACQYASIFNVGTFVGYNEFIGLLLLLFCDIGYLAAHHAWAL